MRRDRERTVLAARVYGLVFIVGAMLLVVLNLYGPAWSAPVVLIVLGLLSAVVPRPTPETERIDGPVRARNSTRAWACWPW